MTTKTSMASNALLYIGHGAIDSIEENEAANELYEGIYQNQVTLRPWSFAKAKVTLNRLATSPINEWEFAYQIPPETLAIFKTYPRTDYKIYDNTILANVESLDADIIARPDEDGLPPYFVKLVEYALAAELAIPITRDAGIAEYWEKKYQEQLIRASNADASQQPATSEQHQPFVRVRGSG